MRHFDRNGNITAALGSLHPGEQVTFKEGGDVYIVLNPGFNGVRPLVALRGWNLTFGRHDATVFVLPPEREWKFTEPLWQQELCAGPAPLAAFERLGPNDYVLRDGDYEWRASRVKAGQAGAGCAV